MWSKALLSGRGPHYTHKDKVEDYPTVTLAQIWELVQRPQQVPKEAAWWFSPTDYIRADGRSAERQKQAGMAHALIADIDNGSPSLQQVLEATRKVAGPFCFMIYSSRSATPEQLKWRVILPLAQALPGAVYEFYQRALRQGYSQLGITCDRSLDLISQPVYLPNRQDFYSYHLEQGPLLQFEFEDGQHPLRLWSLEYQQDQQAVNQSPPNEGARSPLAAFRRKHSIEAMLLAYACSPSPSNPDLWRYNFQSSLHFGAIRIMRYGDSDRWVSRSDSFNALGAGRATAHNSRMGDAYDLYVAFGCRGDADAALRYAQQCLEEEDAQRYGAATAEHGRELYNSALRLGPELGPAGHRLAMQESTQRAEAMKTPEPEAANEDHDWDIDWPPGVVGEMAKYLYRISSRPVKQFAIAKALYILGGMAGQRYNIEGFGLNLYMMVVGNSGTGKGEARRGAKRIYGAYGDLAQDASGVSEVYDNNFPASESGLRKMFETRGSKAIYREDADALLESMTSTQPGSNGDKLRGALSEFYDQSGAGLNMGAVRYAKAEDSTGMVQSPALTLGLDLQVDPFKRFLGHGIILSTGIAARFIYVTRYGLRSHAQYGREAEMPLPMLDQLKTIWNGLRVQAAGVTDVQWQPSAKDAFYKMDWDITERIRRGKAEEDLLNRAHMNAARVAACLAVGLNQIAPVVTDALFAWAKRFVMLGYEDCLGILGRGEAGAGENVRVAKAVRAVYEYIKMTPETRVSTYKVPRALDKFDDVICEKYFIMKLRNVADYKGVDNGPSTEDIIRRTIMELVRQEYLAPVDRQTLMQERGCILHSSIKQPLYALGPSF